MIIYFHTRYTRVKELLQALDLPAEAQVSTFNESQKRIDPRTCEPEDIPCERSGRTWLRLEVHAWSMPQQESLYRFLHDAPKFSVSASEMRRMQAGLVLPAQE